MSGYSDLTVYESEEERNAVCAELARMLRIVPLQSSPAPATGLPPCRTPAAAGAGDSFATPHGISA